MKQYRCYRCREIFKTKRKYKGRYSRRICRKCFITRKKTKPSMSLKKQIENIKNETYKVLEI